MKYSLQIALVSILSFFSFLSHADSSIRVNNNSSVALQGIWQAGGCASIQTDWEGDKQYTVCHYATMEPGESQTGTFGLFAADRSVKVFARGQGRVAYCNSMDDETITISDADDLGVGNLHVESSC